MKRIMLCLIFAFAIFVRLYNTVHFPSYTSEIAQHYLEIKKITEGIFLLNGPLTSHSWLRLGAIPYYMFSPILYIARFHPLTLFYFWTIVDILMLFVNFYIVKKLINKNTALFSTLFLSISPFHLMFNRIPGFYSFIIPFIYVLLHYFNKIIKKKSAPFWPIFLIIGFMINLHATAVLLIPLCIFLGIALRKFSKKTIVQSLIVFLIPNIPFVVKESLNGFTTYFRLLAWIPYKLLNFVTGKTLGLNRAIAPDVTIFTIIDFLKTNFFPSNYPFIFGVLILSALVIFLFFKRHRPIIYIIYFWLFFGLATLMIHKNPPLHYFIPISLLPIILLSNILDELFKKYRMIISLIILIMIVTNIIFIFSPQYLFQKQSRDMFNISYKTQEKIARFIIHDVKGQKFTLSRIGPFDTYANQFKENYEYLLWWLDNEPVKKSNIQYLIAENKNKIPQNKSLKRFAEINGITILKKD